ncbi:MAG: single-stranded-DNA-specific exonuclease RecJ [Candidatus Caldatribacteriota bacterium]|nr:single-stranded-DNA-specific exonuclease RecJ [Candidatus Caldatribacteriota bacterium]
MKIEWHVFEEDKELQSKLSRELKISPILAQLLINREMKSVRKIRKFLEADLKNLRDPYLFRDMGKTVDRIIKAIKGEERILIYGDYDVDGLTSTALLFLVLKEFTPNIYYYIPNRFQEGYGLNEKAIDIANKNKINLIITVDCGISSVSEIEKANNYGIDVIIVDHHIPRNSIPSAKAVINPKCDENYPFKELAGVGVSFKVAQALYSKLEIEQKKLIKLLDYVALGSIADSVPFIDENRILIKHGLKYLNKTGKEGLRALIDECGLNCNELTTKDVNYALAPRLNAAGRLGDPKLALELLLTKSKEKANYLAKKLDEINKKRRNIGDDIFKEAKIQAQKQVDEEDNNVLVLSSDNWNQGVIGIIASRLVEEFNRPVIVISKKDEIGKGSGRSTKGFHLYKAIEKCKDLLIDFGGHKYAAGITIDSNKISEFKLLINQISQKFIKNEDLKLELDIDASILLNEIDFNLIKDINLLEPFGLGNPKPVFCSYENNVFDWKLVGGKKSHLKLKVIEKSKLLDGIGFKLAKTGSKILSENKLVNLAFNVELNKWNGAENVQINIKDIKSIHSGGN